MLSKQNYSEMLIITLTLLIVPIQQIAIDIYLPSFPIMVKYFHTTPFFIQLSLTLYIFSLGVSQFFYGPATDSFGRKYVFLTGASISLLATCIIIFTDNIHILLYARVLQGLGLGSGFVVASAIMTDVFSGEKLARITSYSSMVYSLPPIIAPVLGAYLQDFFNWQANFIFIALYTLGLIFLLLIFLPETSEPQTRHPVHFKTILHSYYTVLSSIHFIAYLFCLMLAFGLAIAFNVIGPFLLQTILHVSVLTYGHLLLIIGLAYFLGTGLNSRFVRYFPIDKLVWTGHIFMVLGGLGLLICSLVGIFNVSLIISMTFIIIFGTGMVFPNCYALALEIFKSRIGIASACLGAGGLIGCAIISAVIAGLQIQSGIGLGLFDMVLSLLCLFSFYLACSTKKAINEQ